MRLALIASLAAISGAAMADDVRRAPGECRALFPVKQQFLDHGATWTTLTPDEWQFMRGVFVMHPETELALPYGDSAVLARLTPKGGGMVFFVDGDQACTPLVVPPEVVEILDQITTGLIEHEGPPL